MADVLLPPWLRITRLRTEYLDNTGMTRSLYTQAPETTGFGGDRLKFSLEFTPTFSTQSDYERSTLRSFLARLRGRQNRAYLWDPSYRQRGSFTATELLSNNTFANGTTGWTLNSGSEVTISSADRILRSKRAEALTGRTIVPTAAATVTQYAPYAARAFIRQGRGSLRFGVRAGSTAGGTDYGSTGTLTSAGLTTLKLVPYGSSVYFGIADLATGKMAGDYMDIPYVSLTRCQLVDNGTNLLLRSEELDNTAAWGSLTSNGLSGVTANAVTAPDGNSTADSIIENSSNSSHLRSQSVTVAATADLDYFLGVALKAGTRTWAAIAMSEATGSTSVRTYFNLSTGATGTSLTGVNWANLRSFVVPLGDGWYYCGIVVRKTNAATTISAMIELSDGDNGRTYTGDGASNIYAWRATMAQSSVPARLVQTTSAASTGTSQSGSALYIKGGRTASEGALLSAMLPDDRFEVITSLGSEMKIVTAPLDFDSAGRGYLQFEPPLRGTPADGAAIIVGNPMTRAIFSGETVGWDDEPGIITRASAEFEEAA